ncbi:MAG TPA: STAS domain-containing protein [Solirubrobacteraceae bacterium]|jgi:anti-sigma B factor antagonist
MEDPLTINLRRESDRAVVEMEGELDMANAPLLQSTIEGAELASAKTIVLDLQQLTFLDSTGLRVILSARELCWRRGQEFAVTPGSQQVQRLLSVTGVGEHLRTIAEPGEMLV